ncbi:M28 family peptidase [filamentous cyanobacterium LEGE 11480]|uniref:M28 family peptidase n=1 Tax=Romeriopsis navalis LEGE 11480 TaxID=2777977 RepID=A0A928Z421_9CYAN|nr:M28 family peptidase [Romeriopsis navalis]MBE9030587.1 M28 family peptidase [Romeriopsis navalis LEGE 11480]
MADLKTRLRSHLLEIVRERDPYLAPQGHFYVQTYIQQTLSQFGDVVLNEFKIKARPHQNIILNLPAQQHQQRSPIIIGAHYDGVPGSPGADDNASGVAVLLELARFFQTHPAKRPLQLIAFDLEEPGWIGSELYAKQLAKQQQKVHLMLSLEMLGYCKRERNTQRYPAPILEKIYPDQGNFIALIGNIPTIPSMLSLGRSMRRSGVPSQWLPAGWKGKFLEELRRSDHAPFWDAGYPAIMVTDTAFLRNPNYHQPTDTFDTLDLDFMAGVCQGLCDGIANL